MTLSEQRLLVKNLIVRRDYAKKYYESLVLVTDTEIANGLAMAYCELPVSQITERDQQLLNLDKIEAELFPIDVPVDMKTVKPKAKRSLAKNA